MFPRTHSFSRPVADEKGLSAHLRTVFNYMTGGLALSGLVAYVTLHVPALLAMAASPAGSIIFLLTWFGLGMFFHSIAFRVQPSTALMLFGLFSVVTGFALAPLFVIYASMDVTLALLAAAGVFAAASIYGHTTQRSLAGLGSFLAVGGIALIIFALVLIGWSFFGGAPHGLSMVFSLLIVPFVTIAIAFKMNMLRESYYAYASDPVTASRMSIVDALGFYTDFVVLFVHLLRIIASVNSNR